MYIYVYIYIYTCINIQNVINNSKIFICTHMHIYNCESLYYKQRVRHHHDVHHDVVHHNISNGAHHYFHQGGNSLKPGGGCMAVVFAGVSGRIANELQKSCGRLIWSFRKKKNKQTINWYLNKQMNKIEN